MPKQYLAPAPRYSRWEWFKFIALRVVFPPVLLWDLAKRVGNNLLGAWIGGMVLPAQNENFDFYAIPDEVVSACNESNLICEKHTIITHDGAQLDSLEVNHVDQMALEPKYQKYIINLVGNAMCYELILAEMKKEAQSLQANVIGFNFRGVGQSTGKVKSKDDLLVDGIAQVQRLLDQGVSSQNITLKGHSLGASIASLVALHFHQLGQPINVFNSRSFSSLTDFVVGMIRLAFNDNLGGKILGWVLSPLIKFAVSLANWEIDAGSAFKRIPEAFRDYIVVRSRKHIREGRLDDNVIPHYASIHKELTSERRAKKSEIDKKIKAIDDEFKQVSPLDKPGIVKSKEALVDARNKVKGDRKMMADLPEMDGHNADWCSLHNRSGQNAQTFFRDFVKRAEEDHGVKNMLTIKTQ
jgi:hypothetical protein